MNYETLLIAAHANSIDVYEVDLKGRIKGLYKDGIVWISKGMSTNEKHCVLAEEIGHHETSVGEILDQSDLRNRKQELQAKQWAYFSVIPLSVIVQAYQLHIKGRHDIADYLNVTEAFLQAAIDRYKEKYGLLAVYDDRYIVCFDPLGVIEIFE
ncbi:ImmA/IrrE family metallo-endopeptidase [Paenibacillus sonchi]|uniref:ImmA/IrrE family metallo-endopeptidase n=1 Tax=Paenibacillus sonchi TaxID=373687 RepID=UPI001E57C850|nr:ImmA/IrrE family metallo-endopeptidase [Paenibacillus sonchi]MCE3202502.1 ImmA/IrrE family metallo-endopeptidase [Paenibacillus sonchi]